MRQIFAHIILVVISLFLPYSLIAQTSTWTGNVSTDWATDGNWSPAGVPGATHTVTIPATGITNRPVLTQNVVVYQLTLSGEIDMKGFKIDAQGGGFIINNATVKNSNASSTSSFWGENHESSESFRIDGSTFEGDVYFHINSNLPQYEAYTSGNHYKNDVTFFYQDSSPTVRTESTYPSLCKNHVSTFDKGLFIWLNDFASTDFPLAFAVGEIIFEGSSNTVIGAVTGSTGTLGLAPVRLVAKNVTINKTGSAKVILEDISENLHIVNSLTFQNGILETGESVVFFLDNAVHSGASDYSHIVTRVYKIGDDAFTFPVGTGSKYTPVSITAPSIVTDAFSAEFIGTAPTTKGYNTASKVTTLSSVYDGGFWDFKRVTGSSDVSLSLGYNVESGVISNQPGLRVAHWVGSQWENLGNGGTSGSLTVGTVSTAAAVSSFSPFTIAFFGAMPVKLVAFSAQSENQTARLQWTTTEETNSSLFEIEHSRDAKNWQKIGERKATGESKSMIHYDYLHTTPIKGVNYYRLKMIDLDGSFAFSRMENLEFSTEVKTAVYPNPVSNKLFIELANGESVSRAEIKTVNGVSALSANTKVSKAGIDLTGLSEGIYVLEIITNTGRKETSKILINK